jgi:hypothetical protein
MKRTKIIPVLVKPPKPTPATPIFFTPFPKISYMGSI